MNIVTEIKQWRALKKQLQNNTIGFIPTMGHLHAGHLHLCQRSKAENDMTIVSIFVNPTQFNQKQDFDYYPRTLDEDIAALTKQGVDFLFCPNPSDMYPDQYEIQVTETNLSLLLEGEFRPGHFNGMLTIVLKLLNIIQPMRAYFGEKDYQQLLLVKKMVAALFIEVDIIACPTIRAEDGLALSSRNSRLNTEQRQMASYFPHILQSSSTVDEIIKHLKLRGFKVDYISEEWQRRLGAVWVDDIRLIDNISLTNE